MFRENIDFTRMSNIDNHYSVLPEEEMIVEDPVYISPKKPPVKQTFVNTTKNNVFVKSSNKDITIYSVIKDEQGNLLMGATLVAVNDKTKYSVADYIGRVSMEVKQDTILELRYLGFKTQRFKASDLKDETIMQEDIEQIGEVEIIGKLKKETNNSFLVLLGVLVALLAYFKS